MRTRLVLRGLPLLGLLLSSCSETSPAADGAAPGQERGAGPRDLGPPPPDIPTEPVQPGDGELTYKLTESTAALPLWTTPVAVKVRTSDVAPSATSSGLHLFAARREFEPAQLVVGPAAGGVTATIAPFPKLGAGQRVQLAVAGYEQGWEEHLTPLASGGSVTLSASSGVPLWITVFVPEGAPAGAHQTTLTLKPASGAAITVPITLTVFDFALPKEIHFDSQLNLSVADLKGSGTALQAKTLLFERRLTPTSVPWPSGFSYKITWDNPQAAAPCSSFWDEPTEGADYSIKALAKKYILGEGWNGVGFPSAEAFQFVDNATPRPATFCGESRGSDHYGTAAYNARWSQWLTALAGYLEANGYLAKSYYYVQNEPQGPEDYKLAAHLCRLSKKAAPKLRLAISEEPKPEIAEEAGGACGYDLWIAHVGAYQQTYAQQRQQSTGEAVWFYSLDQDPDPYFNPTRVDRAGLHQRIIPWVSWHYRASGWAYYDGGRFFDGAQPGYRAELLREGFEDYEYLYLANGGKHPRVGVKEVVDATVDSAASSLTSWSKNAEAMAALRRELGRYIEGSRKTLPVLAATSSVRPRGEYYLNFQDPAGKPTASPLVVGGKTYLKVGWQAYDAKTQLGWSGENIGKPAITLTGYDDVAGYSEAQKSYLYDDYGRRNLFELGLESGRYAVTVGVGRPAKGYPNDPHNVTVEGVVAVNDEPTTSAQPTLERTVTVDLKDGSLSVEVGGKSQKTGDFAYTFLAYLKIVPVD